MIWLILISNFVQGALWVVWLKLSKNLGKWQEAQRRRHESEAVVTRGILRRMDDMNRRLAKIMDDLNEDDAA